MVEWLSSTTVDELITKSRLKSLKTELEALEAADLVETIEAVGAAKGLIVLRLLPPAKAAEVFTELTHSLRDELLEALTSEKLTELLQSMAPDDRTRIFEEMPGEAVQRLVNLLEPADRRTALALLGFPEGSVGRLMTPNYIMVRPDFTVRQALDHVRSRYVLAETANDLYVVDESGVLIDDILLGAVVAAPPGQRVRDVMDYRFVALQANQDQEEAVALFRRHYRSALPVVDSGGKLIGIVTLDDILAVSEREATEDFQKVGGLEALNEPYLATGFWTLIRKRGGWLLVLFLSEMLTASAMGRFEDEIAKAVVLALFVPLIISSGGNSGSQAASLIIRALAIGEVRTRDWWMVMRRELLSGLVLGIALGLVGFSRIALWSQFSNVYGPHWVLVATTIFVSLIGVVMWGTLSGSMLPLALKRIGLDPAVSSAPFVATLVDVTGIFIYFEVAMLVLKGTLL
ncbi:MAG: magnesium transporter [Fimbriimonadaceae bacterium]|nr:magnesium transporter [Fimbriimonadaceae bacterium]